MTDKDQTPADDKSPADDMVPMDKTAETASPESANSEAISNEADGSDPMAPPPASFEVLISMLFTQAMAALGQMPNPTTGKAELNKPFAKHFIDTMEMLGEKTEGNRSEDESKMLSEALHVLRMSYVSAGK